MRVLQVLLRVVKDTYPDADNIDIVAGFIKDDAGNAATTDAAAPSYADSLRQRSNFTSTLRTEARV